ncbi:hypothetical protein [Halobellus salinus]|uniref:hypothetical protein n=1 Tax=Halobellus salinus TaxID=931585 RepID=UPI00166A5556|nr:hypothetical protein [Halobellus salinus]
MDTKRPSGPDRAAVSTMLILAMNRGKHRLNCQFSTHILCYRIVWKEFVDYRIVWKEFVDYRIVWKEFVGYRIVWKEFVGYRIVWKEFVDSSHD